MSKRVYFQENCLTDQYMQCTLCRNEIPPKEISRNFYLGKKLKLGDALTVCVVCVHVCVSFITEHGIGANIQICTVYRLSPEVSVTFGVESKCSMNYTEPTFRERAAYHFVENRP